MQKFGAARCRAAIVVVAVLTILGPAGAELPLKSQIVAGIMSALVPADDKHDGVLTVYDGNMFVQCLASHYLSAWRCEAAGLAGQSWLSHVLTPERREKLTTLGFAPDATFGNFTANLPATTPPETLADLLVRALQEGYGVSPDDITVKAERIRSARCHRRMKAGAAFGGSILTPHWGHKSDAVAGCRGAPEAEDRDDPTSVMPTAAVSDITDLYIPKMTEQLQRLDALPKDQDAFVIFAAGPAYVQCMDDIEGRRMYCEASSSDAVGGPVARILTPERIDALRAAGFTPPGKVMNYWRFYPRDEFDIPAVAHALIDVLKTSYGYQGAPPMRVKTEKGPQQELIPNYSEALCEFLGALGCRGDGAGHEGGEAVGGH